jgi:3-oxoadipate enol-lactonase
MIAPLAVGDIGFEDVGSGSPILFLHGYPHSRALWSPQLGALTGQARCIAPDLRGFGESVREGPFSMDRYAEDAEALLAHLGVTRTVVCGLSMGGYVAFALWRRRPDLVRALVLADTRAGPDTPEAREKRRAQQELARTRGAGAVADAMMEGMLGKTTRATKPDVVATVHTMLASSPVEGIVGALDALMSRPDSTPTLATITVPTLIACGEEDVLTPPKEAHSMHEAIAGSRLELIAEAGHLTNRERPSAFNLVLCEFLATLDAN